MNFFKAVFLSDTDPLDPSSEEKFQPDSIPKPRDDNEEDVTTAATASNPEPNSNPNPNPKSPWVELGSLIKTFATKSETVIQTYRRDLEEFSSGLKKETEAIREVASRAVRDLPSSLEAGASAAQESLESVGQAIDELGGSVWRGTTEFISQGKDTLLTYDSEVDANSSDLQTPSSAGVNASASKRYSRFEVQVLAMQSDPSTFSEVPEDMEDFSKWMSEFKLEEKEVEIETLCYDNGTLEGLFEKLVPYTVDYNTFWSRYFYKLYKLKQAEDVRSNLVKRVISREDEDEDLTWEVEDDEEEGKQEKEFGNEDDGERNVDNREEDEVKMEIKGEIKDEIAERREEKGAGDVVESVTEKKLDGASEDLTLEVASSADEETKASSPPGVADDVELAINESTSKFDDKVLLDAKADPVVSCKDSGISIVSSQPSILEDEDLEWDEIEDLGEHDDKKVSGCNSSPIRVDIHQGHSVPEQDEDLSWDIEDAD